jgi:hypothetical protein
MIAAASSADRRPWIVRTGTEPLENDDIMGGGTASDSEPADVPLVGVVRDPGVTTGLPFPGVRSVVQPNAAMVAQRETARNARFGERSAKLLLINDLLI